MGLNDFINKFAAQFEETNPSLFLSSTRFREELEEWDSMIALSVMAMVDAEYHVVLKGEEMRKCQTIEDLFNLVRSKI